MTEQELITSMQALTNDASAVLAALVTFAEQNTDVVFGLSNGQTVSVPSLPKQVAAYATQQAADRLALLQNFGGIPTAQAVTRDASNKISSVTTTFANGYQTIQSLARDAVTGQITSLTNAAKDPLGNQIWTLTKTIQRINGKYSGV